MKESSESSRRRWRPRRRPTLAPPSPIAYQELTATELLFESPVWGEAALRGPRGRKGGPPLPAWGEASVPTRPTQRHCRGRERGCGCLGLARRRVRACEGGAAVAGEGGGKNRGEQPATPWDIREGKSWEERSRGEPPATPWRGACIRAAGAGEEGRRRRCRGQVARARLEPGCGGRRGARGGRPGGVRRPPACEMGNRGGEGGGGGKKSLTRRVDQVQL